MVIEPGILFEELQGNILGRAVSFRRLACDSLHLYLDCEPGDRSGLGICFEPIWHFCGPNGVLLGSMQVAAVCESEEAMSAVADGPLKPLLGRVIEGLAIDPLTFDLTVILAGGYRVCTFAADATGDYSWHIRDNATGTSLKGSPGGLSIPRTTAESE
jgi:hypothetical protein